MAESFSYQGSSWDSPKYLLILTNLELLNQIRVALVLIFNVFRVRFGSKSTDSCFLSFTA